MEASPHFKHVNGRNGKMESICMNCLLAVGIFVTDKELLSAESMHRCSDKAGEVVLNEFQSADRPKSMSLDVEQTCGNPPHDGG